MELSEESVRARGAGERLGTAGTLPRLVFVHVPKTAGTSLTSALTRAYGASTFPGMTTLDYVCRDEGQLAAYRLYKGHAYRRDYERLPGGTLRFTVLRDPVARAISFFKYYRSLDASHVTDQFMLDAIRLARRNTIIEFLYSDAPFIIEQVRLGQLRQFLTAETLAQIAHRQFLTGDLRRRAFQEFIEEIGRFTYVMTTESLSLSFPLMAAELGLPSECRHLARENESPTASDVVDDCDVRRALVDISGPEFSCYDYVRRREQALLTKTFGSTVAPDPTSYPEIERSEATARRFVRPNTARLDGMKGLVP